MSKYKTLWGLYYISADRTWGTSDFFGTYEEALDAKVGNLKGDWYILEQTYELEEESYHNCGDDE